MAAKKPRSIPTQLEAANIAITNSLNDPMIMDLVGAYGYTNERLQQGQQLYIAAVNAVNAQAVAEGAKRHAAIQCDTAEKLARKNYKALTKIIRTMFSVGSAERATLDIRGPMPAALAEFLTTARTLYDNALNVPHIRAALAEYGYDQARLSAEQAAVAACEQARQAEVAAISAAIEATQAQTKALKTLQGWMVRYRAVVSTALEHAPQLRARLGLAVRSTVAVPLISDTSAPAPSATA